MPSVHDGHRQRIRQEFLRRSDAFPDHRLLELLLFYALPRGDVNPMAHELLSCFGSFSGVLDALPEELEKVPGVGESVVALLKAVKEAGGRYLSGRSGCTDAIRNVDDAVALLRPYFFGARDEQVYLVCMDGKSRCLGIRKVAHGGVNSAELTFRKVLEAALALNAARVILAHNHISGVALPSPEDKLTTERLEQVLSCAGIILDDHLVLTSDDAVSMRESGWVK